LQSRWPWPRETLCYRRPAPWWMRAHSGLPSPSAVSRQRRCPCDFAICIFGLGDAPRVQRKDFILGLEPQALRLSLRSGLVIDPFRPSDLGMTEIALSRLDGYACLPQTELEMKNGMGHAWSVVSLPGRGFSWTAR